MENTFSKEQLDKLSKILEAVKPLLSPTATATDDVCIMQRTTYAITKLETEVKEQDVVDLIQLVNQHSVQRQTTDVSFGNRAQNNNCSL